MIMHGRLTVNIDEATYPLTPLPSHPLTPWPPLLLHE